MGFCMPGWDGNFKYILQTEQSDDVSQSDAFGKMKYPARHIKSISQY